MSFPASLKQARNEFDNKILPEDILLTHNNKYLGSIITPLLIEDTKIETRMKKAITTRMLIKE